MKRINKNFKSRATDPFVIKHGDFQDGKLEYSYLEEWIESSFVPKSRDKEVVGRTFDFLNLKIGALIISALFLILIGRAVWLQIIKGDYYSAMAEGNSVRQERLEARRGIIYDRNLNPLVRNAANFLLYILPAELPSDEAKEKDIIERMSLLVFPLDKVKADELKSSLEEKISKVKNDFSQSQQPIFVADNLSHDSAMKIYLAENNLPGVIISIKDKREYLDDGVLSFSHVLGYIGKANDADIEKLGDTYTAIDYLGKAGLESFWEKDLRGVNGLKRVEVDALGHEKKILSQEAPQDGNNLVLSIDSDLQKKSEEILSANLKKLNLTKGAVIISDPNNGEILSLVSLPTFDNRLFAEGISADDYKKLIEDKDNPMFNRAISGEYPSGSTVKMIFAAAALQEKVITENTTILSNGGLKVAQWFFPDWKAGGHGLTSVRKAIAESVNTFFYYIGGGYQDFVGLGIERLVKYLNLFGLGNTLGIDLPNEATGFVPSQEWKEKVKGEKWYIGDTYNLSIGQGDLLVTPLQVNEWTAYFAAGGKEYQPHVVKEILDSNDKTIKTITESPLRDTLIDSYNVEIVRQGMRQTVTSGSAKRLLDLPVDSAAKTGTAQWNTTKDPHAWFTAFAPYKNPQIVITVLVEEGKEGSSVALTVAHDIMAYYFQNHPVSDK